MKDEIYQFKNYSRDNVRVLMRLDDTKLDLKNPRVHRTDQDFAVTWVKSTAKAGCSTQRLGMWRMCTITR